MDRREFLQSCAAAAGASVLPLALGQEVPEGTASVYAGFPAGSSVDLLARLLADHAHTVLKRPVIVMNQPGATGMISLERLKRAPADGSVVGLVPVTSGVIAPMFRTRPDFNLQSDFEPVAMVGFYSLAFSVSATLGVPDWKAFRAWAQAHPQDLFYGHAGTGSMGHMVGALLAGATGLALHDVPFKSDTESLSSVIAGQTPVAIGSTLTVNAQYKAGKVRTLAVTGRERAALMPEVPTFVELGYPNAVAEPWMAIFAPKGTPAPAIAAWNRVVNTTLADPAARQTLASQGYAVGGGTPEQLASIVSADTARYRKVMDAAGLKPLD